MMLKFAVTVWFDPERIKEDNVSMMLDEQLEALYLAGIDRIQCTEA
jgi:hypothetical protein